MNLIQLKDLYPINSKPINIDLKQKDINETKDILNYLLYFKDSITNVKI